MNTQALFTLIFDIHEGTKFFLSNAGLSLGLSSERLGFILLVVGREVLAVCGCFPDRFEGFRVPEPWGSPVTAGMERHYVHLGIIKIIR